MRKVQQDMVSLYKKLGIRITSILINFNVCAVPYTFALVNRHSNAKHALQLSISKSVSDICYLSSVHGRYNCKLNVDSLGPKAVANISSLLTR